MPSCEIDVISEEDLIVIPGVVLEQPKHTKRRRLSQQPSPNEDLEVPLVGCEIDVISEEDLIVIPGDVLEQPEHTNSGRLSQQPSPREELEGPLASFVEVIPSSPTPSEQEQGTLSSPSSFGIDVIFEEDLIVIPGDVLEQPEHTKRRRLSQQPSPRKELEGPLAGFVEVIPSSPTPSEQEQSTLSSPSSFGIDVISEEDLTVIPGDVLEQPEHTNSGRQSQQPSPREELEGPLADFVEAIPSSPTPSEQGQGAFSSPSSFVAVSTSTPTSTGVVSTVSSPSTSGVFKSPAKGLKAKRALNFNETDPSLEEDDFGYAWDKVDIYSASWGPNDDGRTVEGPGRLAVEAFKRGITQGRGGKGNIYVWANGNGGGHNDNCNCDGYSSSIYTISIGSASQHGLFPWYGEICSSTLATAYSSGAYKDQKIATTDTKDSCTLGHTGTSAAAPLAAGIIALALQANSNLTWRDVQHLIVWTSEYAPLSVNPGWQINGAGFRFDIRFGFGLMNAGALVAAALNWTTVPEKTICRIQSPPFQNDQGKMFSKEQINVPLKVGDDCAVNYIEHVELIVNIRYTRRGALQVYLISPQGTKVQVLSARPRDASPAGFVDWPLTSVATWGENPKGAWTVVIEDTTNEDNRGDVGQLTLVIHGTTEMPAHMKNGPRVYNNEYNNYEDTNYYMPNHIPDEDEASQVPGPHSSEADSFNEIDPTILAEVEKELQRIHHRIYYSSRGV